MSTSKQRPTAKPVLVPLSEIEIPEYQRGIVGTVGKINREGFNEYLAGTILLGDRSKWRNGTSDIPTNHKALIDGHQRNHVMKGLNYSHTWAMVIPTDSLEDEAGMFLAANEGRTVVSTQDRHVAGLIARNPINVGIEDAAIAAGLTFNKRDKSGLVLIDPIGQVKAVHKWATEKCDVPDTTFYDGLEVALTSMKAAWYLPAWKRLTGNAVASITLLAIGFSSGDAAADVELLTKALAQNDLLVRVEKNFAAEHPHMIRQRNPRAWRFWLRYLAAFPNPKPESGRGRSKVRQLYPLVDDWTEEMVGDKILRPQAPRTRKRMIKVAS